MNAEDLGKLRLKNCLLRISFCALAILFLRPLVAGGESVRLQVDFTRTAGVLRPLHGINKGPLAPGGIVDVIAEHRQLRIPFTRLHDCHWPNPDVVDVHAVFPDFSADPADVGSYEFALTDEYLEAIKATGADIIYRLGESIEHGRIKRFVHPPADPEKWAAICLGIIRHYNEGWAAGFRHNIRYWEIWNEPENRPAMWSGDDEDYFRLYAVTAKAIKRRYPDLKVGGPSVGASGEIVGGEFRPSSFTLAFLERCRSENLPLDFFSWHCYTDEPVELVLRAKAIRRLLDRNGFAGTESHLNEWNLLPGKNWDPLSRTSPALSRQQFFQTMAGAPGAAFIAAALLQLQDAPVDVCNLFHGELGGFGLFSEHGVPQKNFHAMRAFAELVETPQRASVTGAGGVAAGAGIHMDRNRAALLISNGSHPGSEFELQLKVPWSGGTAHELRLVDEQHDFEIVSQGKHEAGLIEMKLKLPNPAVAYIVLHPIVLGVEPR